VIVGVIDTGLGEELHAVVEVVVDEREDIGAIVRAGQRPHVIVVVAQIVVCAQGRQR